MVNNTTACKFSEGDYNSCKDYDCRTGMCKLFSTVVYVTDDIHVSYSHKWISYQWDFLVLGYDFIMFSLRRIHLNVNENEW